MVQRDAEGVNNGYESVIGHLSSLTSVDQHPTLGAAQRTVYINSNFVIQTL
ncbi:hypothetical protein [Devosia sp. DBB001]|nr:hypothetical protein [Devosia sp. DBB001]